MKPALHSGIYIYLFTLYPTEVSVVLFYLCIMTRYVLAR